MRKWQVEYMLNCEITYVYWDIVSYESYNHTIIRPFKWNELMRNEYCDGIHCGNRTSLITLRRDELKLFWEQLRSHVCFVQFIDRVCVLKYFLR